MEKKNDEEKMKSIESAAKKIILKKYSITE